MYAQNGLGPASTPIQLMNNLVIPSLKRVAEGAINDDDVPFLSNAIHEASSGSSEARYEGQVRNRLVQFTR